MKTLGMALAIVFALAPRARAHDGHDHGKAGKAKKDHAHGSPHGGLVQTVGKGHLEVLIKGENLMVYVLDDKEATVTPPKDGKAVLLIGKTKHDLTLAAHGDHLMATLSKEVQDHLTAAKGKAVAVVTIVMGKPHSGRFKLTLPKDTPAADKPAAEKKGDGHDHGPAGDETTPHKH